MKEPNLNEDLEQQFNNMKKTFIKWNKFTKINT